MWTKSATGGGGGALVLFTDKSNCAQVAEASKQRIHCD